MHIPWFPPKHHAGQQVTQIPFGAVISSFSFIDEDLKTPGHQKPPHCMAILWPLKGYLIKTQKLPLKVIFPGSCSAVKIDVDDQRQKVAPQQC